MPGADQQDVTDPDADALRPLRRVEVLGEHVLTRLEPADAPGPGYVEKHPTTDQAVAQQVDGVGGRAPGRDLGDGDAPVELALVPNVAERVDVAVTLVVVVDADVVLREAQAAGSDVDVGEQRHLVIRRLGVVDAPMRVERPAERDGQPPVDQPRGGHDPVGGEVVQRPHLRPLVPPTPVDELPEEAAEIAGAQVDVTRSLPGLTRRHDDGGLQPPATTPDCGPAAARRYRPRPQRYRPGVAGSRSMPAGSKIP
jgi:hypothetical protein